MSSASAIVAGNASLKKKKKRQAANRPAPTVRGAESKKLAAKIKRRAERAEQGQAEEEEEDEEDNGADGSSGEEEEEEEDAPSSSESASEEEEDEEDEEEEDESSEEDDSEEAADKRKHALPDYNEGPLRVDEQYVRCDAIAAKDTVSVCRYTTDSRGEMESEADKRVVDLNVGLTPHQAYEDAITEGREDAPVRRYAVNWRWTLPLVVDNPIHKETITFASPLSESVPLVEMAKLVFEQDNRLLLANVDCDRECKARIREQNKNMDQLDLPLRVHLVSSRNTLPASVNVELHAPNLGFADRETDPLTVKLQMDKPVRLVANTRTAKDDTLLYHIEDAELLHNPEFSRWGYVSSGQLVASVEEEQKKNTGSVFVKNEKRRLYEHEVEKKLMELARATATQSEEERNKAVKAKRKELKDERVKTRMLHVRLDAKPTSAVQVIAVGYAHAVIAQCKKEGVHFRLETAEEDGGGVYTLVLPHDTFFRVVDIYCTKFNPLRLLVPAGSLQVDVVPVDPNALLMAAKEPANRSLPATVDVTLEVEYVRVERTWTLHNSAPSLLVEACERAACRTQFYNKHFASAVQFNQESEVLSFVRDELYAAPAYEFASAAAAAEAPPSSLVPVYATRRDQLPRPTPRR